MILLDPVQNVLSPGLIRHDHKPVDPVALLVLLQGVDQYRLSLHNDILLGNIHFHPVADATGKNDTKIHMLSSLYIYELTLCVMN